MLPWQSHKGRTYSTIFVSTRTECDHVVRNWPRYAFEFALCEIGRCRHRPYCVHIALLSRVTSRDDRRGRRLQFRARRCLVCSFDAIRPSTRFALSEIPSNRCCHVPLINAYASVMCCVVLCLCCKPCCVCVWYIMCYVVFDIMCNENTLWEEKPGRGIGQRWSNYGVSNVL